VVYYADDQAVYALHVPTAKRKRLAVLDFRIQCLTAGFGWVCVGGDYGKFAFIDVRKTQPMFSSISSIMYSGAEVDALLPLNLDPNPHAADVLPEPHPLQGPLPREADIYTRVIGHEMVNSITVHRLRGIQRGTADEEVAVVSTNDQNVQIFSLHQLEVLKVLEFSTNMNHASISPDGELLIACGDNASAFFCRRKQSQG
jgi:hypothetical protein